MCFICVERTLLFGKVARVRSLGHLLCTDLNTMRQRGQPDIDKSILTT